MKFDEKSLVSCVPDKTEDPLMDTGITKIWVE